MRIIGVGTDAAEIERVARLYERFPETFLTRVFTEREREYCVSRKRNCAESLAARWAAKEATFKALGTGWAAGVSWTDVEVVSRSSGAPELVLSGGAKMVADALEIVDWKISLTHSRTLAIAFVVASALDESPKTPQNQ